MDPETYVSHPINAFHLLKRTANQIPKLREAAGELFNDEDGGGFHAQFEDVEKKNDFLAGATFGLLNLQVYHNLNIEQLANGSGFFDVFLRFLRFFSSFTIFITRDGQKWHKNKVE